MPKEFTYTVDLIPEKPDPKLLKLGDTTVTVSIKAKKDVPQLFLKRINDKAKIIEQIKKYQDLLQPETAKLAEKLKTLQANKEGKAPEVVKKEMAASAEMTTKTVRNAIAALDSLVKQSVKRQFEEEVKRDKQLGEAAIIGAFTAGFKAIQITVDVAKIGVSGGADFAAYFSLASNIKDLANQFKGALASERKIRMDVARALGGYREVAEMVADDADEERQSSLKKSQEKFNKALALHRNALTKEKNYVMSLAKKRDELKARIAKEKDPKKLGFYASKWPALNKGVDDAYYKFRELEDLEDAMVEKAKGKGIVVKDDTLINQWKKSVGEGTDGLLSALSDIADIASDIMGMAKGK